MPSVGSSSNSTLGLLTSARAMASCCCCPPHRLPPRPLLLALPPSQFRSVEGHGAAARREEADERLEQSGLAHAVAPHHRDGLVFAQLEAHVADDVAFAVIDVEVVGL